MPITPSGLVSEAMFPLGDDFTPEPFDVIVSWSDLSESPTQCIARLNREVVEAYQRFGPIETVMERHVTKPVVTEARNLCRGTEMNANSEYVRALAEVIIATVGILNERKPDLMAWLCKA